MVLDMRKTKSQLIGELREFRERVAVLEGSGAEAELGAPKGARRLEDIVNRSPALVFVWRAAAGEWPVEFVSENVQRILGYTADDFTLGRVSWSDITHPEDARRVEAKAAQCLEEGTEEWSQEFRLMTESGETRWCQDHSLSLRDPNGDIAYIQSIVLDVTERKRAEEALKLHSEIVANMAEGVMLSRAEDGVIVYANPTYERMFGYDSGGLVGKYVSILNAPGEKTPEEVAGEIVEVLNVQGTWHGEILNIKADATPFRCRASVSAFDHAEYGPVWVTVQEDITRRNEAERTLRESEERHRAVFEQAAESIVLVDAETGALVDFNDKAHECLGYTHEEFGKLQISDIEVIESPEDVTAHVERIIKEGGSIFETKHRAKSGEVRDVHVSSRAISLGGKPFCLSLWLDITERRQAEEQVRALTQQLMQAQEAERQRISHALHDQVAQDLSSLKMACAALLDTQSQVPVDLRQALKKLPEMLNQSIRTVRDLGYDLHAPALAQLGLVSVVREHCEDVSERKGVPVDFSAAGMDGLTLDLDAAINVYRLIQEALNNIIRHAEAKNATIRLVASYPKIILSIEDDGKGFDVEARQFSALKDRRLGLRVMAERVHLLQGTMSIRSVPMKGTAIRIEIPHKEVSREKSSHC